MISDIMVRLKLFNKRSGLVAFCRVFAHLIAVYVLQQLHKWKEERFKKNNSNTHTHKIKHAQILHRPTVYNNSLPVCLLYILLLEHVRQEFQPHEIIFETYLVWLYFSLSGDFSILWLQKLKQIQANRQYSEELDIFQNYRRLRPRHVMAKWQIKFNWTENWTH